MPMKCLIGAPEINKIPKKIIKTSRAVPKSRSNKIRISTTANPGEISQNGDFLPAYSPILRSCSAHQRINRNFAISDGCKVNPAISIQFLFPFTFFPKNGTNGNNKITMEMDSAYRAILGQTAP